MEPQLQGWPGLRDMVAVQFIKIVNQFGTEQHLYSSSIQMVVCSTDDHSINLTVLKNLLWPTDAAGLDWSNRDQGWLINNLHFISKAGIKDIKMSNPWFFFYMKKAVNLTICICLCKTDRCFLIYIKSFYAELFLASMLLTSRGDHIWELNSRLYLPNVLKNCNFTLFGALETTIPFNMPHTILDLQTIDTSVTISGALVGDK